jgi:hypothetical protein
MSRMMGELTTLFSAKPGLRWCSNKGWNIEADVMAIIAMANLTAIRKTVAHSTDGNVPVPVALSLVSVN